jgi:hypothetical protein
MVRIESREKLTVDNERNVGKKVTIRAYIQRQGSILTWIVILSVYGADTIAEVKLLISPFLC